MTGGARRVGTITRGTTHPNRLRRIDRFITGPLGPRLLSAADPLVVDLGYGASPVTTVELARRLRSVRPDVEVVGAEIDPARVALGQDHLARRPERGVAFVHAGFELGGPVLAERRPCLVRAANVWRQYDEPQVADQWAMVAARLAPGGMLIDATCNEIGRVASWLTVDHTATPLTLTISLRLAGLEHPAVVAERLPKTLIHRNVPGEWVHDLLNALDDAWARNAPLASFGARQRFRASCADLVTGGWPVVVTPRRWALGELTVRHPAAGIRINDGARQPPPAAD